MEATKGVADHMQYLTFYLGEEEYGIGILRVKEIIEYQVPTRIPVAPSCIRGVINVRGSVVPVLDLAVKFGIAPSPVTKRTCIVIVEVELDEQATVMGLVADAVSEVRELATQDIEPPPDFGTQVPIDYLQGMGKVGEKFALLLDVDRVLSVEDLETAAAVASGDPEASGASEIAASTATEEDVDP